MESKLRTNNAMMVIPEMEIAVLASVRLNYPP